MPTAPAPLTIISGINSKGSFLACDGRWKKEWRTSKSGTDWRQPFGEIKAKISTEPPTNDKLRKSYTAACENLRRLTNGLNYHNKPDKLVANFGGRSTIQLSHRFFEVINPI